MPIEPLITAYAGWVASNIDSIAKLALASVALRICVVCIRARTNGRMDGIWTVTHIAVQFVPVVGYLCLVWQIVMLLAAMMFDVVKSGEEK